MTLGRKVCWYEKSAKKNRKKIVQWSYQKRVLGEGVQFFLKDLPYLVGFIRSKHLIMNQTIARFFSYFFFALKMSTPSDRASYDKLWNCFPDNFLSNAPTLVIIRQLLKGPANVHFTPPKKSPPLMRLFGEI